MIILIKYITHKVLDNTMQINVYLHDQTETGGMLKMASSILNSQISQRKRITVIVILPTLVRN